MVTVGEIEKGANGDPTLGLVKGAGEVGSEEAEALNSGLKAWGEEGFVEQKGGRFTFDEECVQKWLMGRK